MDAASLLTLPHAILFDMDGTITEPMLDFPRIKAEMGIGPGPILESLAALPGEARAVAEAVLLRHEADAAERSRLNPGCRELLAWLSGRRIKTALITRNSRLSVSQVIGRHGLEFSVLISREDAPPKPDRAPLLLACRMLGVCQDQSWMIGDSGHDIEAASAAGMRSVWISHRVQKSFAAGPWKTVADLHALRKMLERIVPLH
ncbi:MAG TPA: HAD family hydrolase [Tepidisphaeraceae bacterium]|jgi:HAD superfamily hydrolase (TIGR01509 family)|nr:HAD family hydrolase [Tepidisphaeraceae bacterium]